MRVCVPVHTCLMQRPGGGPRTIWESQFSPSATRVSGADPELSITLGKKPLYLQSHLASPLSFFKHLPELGLHTLYFKVEVTII